MKKWFTALVWLLIVTASQAQMNIDPSLDYSKALECDYEAFNPTPYIESITVDDLKSYLNVLASDEFEGRETGTAGNQKAAEYIRDKFQSFGIPPIPGSDTYFQPIQFNWISWNRADIKVNNEVFRHGWDFLAYHVHNTSLDLKNVNEVVFAGYGIEEGGYSDYAEVDAQDKVLIVLQGEPTDKLGNSLISGSKEVSDWSTDWTKKIKLAKSKGAKTILIVHNKLQKLAGENRNMWFGRHTSLGATIDFDQFCNSIYISSSFAQTLMGKSYKRVVKARKKIQKKKKPSPITIPVDMSIMLDKKESYLKGENVLGFIEGTDPELKNEIVVVSAHYDHLGKRGNDVYNGADDNGSGTSTVLEIAQAFAKAKAAGVGPRRSVLCILVTGEEKGLLGSKYYTSVPVFPLENTVVDINVDMVGRVDKKYKDNPEYIYVIGSDRLSTALHAINEGVNEKYTNLTLDYTYNAESDPNRYYYRSDHYNFAEKGIPAIFYFNGTHKDYHRTTDTVDKIEFDKMAKIANLVFYTAWEIANRDNRIQVDVVE